MSNYGNNPNYQNQPGSKLGKFILDPKASVKNYLNEALVGDNQRQAGGYPGPTYPGGPVAGGSPYGNHNTSYNNQNHNNAPYQSGPNNNQYGGPAGPPLSQPMPVRPASSSTLTDPSSIPHIPQINSPPINNASLQPRTQHLAHTLLCLWDMATKMFKSMFHTTGNRFSWISRFALMEEIFHGPPVGLE
jgi:hypothetical protein